MTGPDNSILIDRQAYLSPTQVAEMLHVKPRTLETWRREGSGPPFRRFAKRVLYKREDVERWLENQPIYTSNADYAQRRRGE